MTTFEDWEVYKCAMNVRHVVAQVAPRVPRHLCEERDQLRRASTSLVANLVEGSQRFHMRDKTQFYRTAAGSAAETIALLRILEMELGECEILARGIEDCRNTRVQLMRLIKSQHKRGDR